jgi:hypothetical protein
LPPARLSSSRCNLTKACTRRIEDRVADGGSAAAAMYALQHEVLASQGILVQGVGRQAYRT